MSTIKIEFAIYFCKGNKMELSEILKELRLEAGLTQKELANKIKIGQSTIVGYEKGEREATLTNLSRYADYFNVSIDFLAGRVDDFGSRTVAPMGDTTTADERDLLEVYRTLSPELRETLWGLLATWTPSKTLKSKKKV